PGNSFNHLVGAAEQRDWERQAKRLGGLEVDEQLNLRGLLDREFRRLGARKNPASKDTTLMAPISNVASVAHEAARRHEFAKLVNRGHSVANSQRRELFAPAREE